MTDAKVQTIVEFEAGSDPIRGQIIRSDTGSEPFIGWLGLIGLLERVASAAAERAEMPDGVPTDWPGARDAGGNPLAARSDHNISQNTERNIDAETF